MMLVQGSLESGVQFSLREWFEEIAEGHLEMVLAEMGNLADFLPDLYTREHRRK